MRLSGFPASDPAPARPTDAERVRSVLAAAHSMSVVTDGLRTEVHRSPGADVLGRFHLHPAPGPADPEGPAARAGDRPAVRLEFTDIAPTPVRDRVRARVTVLGRLLTPHPAAAPSDPAASTCVEYDRAVLETAEGIVHVGLDELDEAYPDPLAAHEAGMLTHLMDGHAELVPLLLRLAPPPAPGCTVLRALPLAMDRYGLTLRVESRHGHHDVRLPFPSRLDDVEQSGAQIQALVSKARRMSHRNTLPA
ncbi:DUF2470 domain-containing protein [Streptomyces sp. NPDC089799]|uniref:DUF2470 domain-containing protein n=1 Tax=Streptomyces sp. NPDC089799 TaxID=3155066 RepID=UPI003443DB31